MRVAITGHTRGIGQAFAEQFEYQGDTVVGFSHSQGFDISKPETQDAIIRELDQCDIFVNNAWAVEAQFDLAKLAYDHWQGTDKVIVIISSKLGVVKDPPEWAKYYAQDKQKLNDWVNSKVLRASPRIFNVVLGLVDTDMSKSLQGNKINPKYIARIVCDLLKYKNFAYIQEIMIDVPDQDWRDINVVNA